MPTFIAKLNVILNVKRTTRDETILEELCNNKTWEILLTLV